MSGFSRIAIAAVLVAGASSVAQAQPRRVHATPAEYYAVSEGRSVAVDRTTPRAAVSSPSESQTVMGLAVPR